MIIYFLLLLTSPLSRVSINAGSGSESIFFLKNALLGLGLGSGLTLTLKQHLSKKDRPRPRVLLTSLCHFPFICASSGRHFCRVILLLFHRGKSFRHKFCKYLTEIRSPKPAHILFLTNCQSISGFFISERAFQSCFSRLYLIITVIIVVNEREMQSEMLCSLCSYDSFCL